MTKAELIREVSKSVGRTQAEIGSILDEVLNRILEKVSSGEEIQIYGFGKFYRVVSPRRTGRNPQTGDEMEIPESATIKFKAYSQAKDVVKNAYKPEKKPGLKKSASK